MPATSWTSISKLEITCLNIRKLYKRTKTFVYDI